MDRKRVLIVDDTEGLRWILKRVLKRGNFNVDSVENGKEALDKLSGKGYDLVLMDMRMPVMSGQDAIEKLEAINPEIKVVILSGYPPSHELEKKIEYGLYGYMPKPFDNNELISCIERALEKAKNDSDDSES